MTAFHEVSRHEQESRLLLVGWFDRSEDALDERLRREMESHPRVQMTGAVEDVTPYYRAMDIFVLPTHREGFPNVALEAAACGLPVVTTCVTGAKDAVAQGETGCLIPAGSPEAIAECVLSLMRDRESRLGLGARGRARVVERFEQQQILRLVVEFYLSQLGASPAGVARDERIRADSANPADFGEVRGDAG